jgi:hypothetical protein
MKFRIPVMILTLAAIGAANAQWKVLFVGPAAASNAYINDASASGYGGAARIANQWRAGIWSSNGSFTDLHPAGYDRSYVFSVSGNEQAGYAVQAGAENACKWNGSSLSFVNLDPSTSYGSRAYGNNGGKQVGYSMFSGAKQAVIWSGTAVSRTSLNPIGSNMSEAYEVAAGKQVGYARVNTVVSASLWSGTSSSWVNLHPLNAGRSEAYCISSDGTQQGGYAQISFTNLACIWSGNRDSATLIHPSQTGALSSFVFGCEGGAQVGYVVMPGALNRAAFWRGTASSHVDLHQFLPSRYTFSYAYALAPSRGGIVVVGEAYNSLTFTGEAVAWFLTEGGSKKDKLP